MILDQFIYLIRESISGIYTFKFRGIIAWFLKESSDPLKLVPEISELSPEVTLLILVIGAISRSERGWRQLVVLNLYKLTHLSIWGAHFLMGQNLGLWIFFHPLWPQCLIKGNGGTFIRGGRGNFKVTWLKLPLRRLGGQTPKGIRLWQSIKNIRI
jgi:hypothetical protein